MDLKGSGHYQEEDIQIHTKFVPDKDVLPVINMKYTEGIVDRSLKRMHREALDLVQFHWWDFDVPGMMETAFDLVKLQEKGKIRNIGMCNMDTNALKQMVDAGIPVVSNQAQYSVFDRRPERTLLDYSAEHGIYTFAYGTLAGDFWRSATWEKNMRHRKPVPRLSICRSLRIRWAGMACRSCFR